MQEYSIDKLGKQEKERPGVRYEKERKELYKGRQSMTWVMSAFCIGKHQHAMTADSFIKISINSFLNR